MKLISLILSIMVITFVVNVGNANAYNVVQKQNAETEVVYYGKILDQIQTAIDRLDITTNSGGHVLLQSVVIYDSTEVYQLSVDNEPVHHVEVRLGNAVGDLIKAELRTILQNHHTSLTVYRNSIEVP